MILTTQNERYWFVRNLALGLISLMGVTDPPVWVENFLLYPPIIHANNHPEANTAWDIWNEIYERLIYVGGKIISPTTLPEDERRYALAREVIIAVGGSKQGRVMGMPNLMVPYLSELQDYFARVLLAPDPMINAYRKHGGGFRDFAQTFLIPDRIAALRWEESLTF
jgi:hypothetical protein